MPEKIQPLPAAAEPLRMPADHLSTRSNRCGSYASHAELSSCLATGLHVFLYARDVSPRRDSFVTTGPRALLRRAIDACRAVAPLEVDAFVPLPDHRVWPEEGWSAGVPADPTGLRTYRTLNLPGDNRSTFSGRGRDRTIFEARNAFPWRRSAAAFGCPAAEPQPTNDR